MQTPLQPRGASSLPRPTAFATCAWPHLLRVGTDTTNHASMPLAQQQLGYRLDGQIQWHRLQTGARTLAAGSGPTPSAWRLVSLCSCAVVAGASFRRAIERQFAPMRPRCG